MGSFVMGLRTLRGNISACRKAWPNREWELRFVIITFYLWRYRLGVRTEDSQSSNPGSIPGSATNPHALTPAKSAGFCSCSQHGPHTVARTVSSCLLMGHSSQAVATLYYIHVSETPQLQRDSASSWNTKPAT